MLTAAGSAPLVTHVWDPPDFRESTIGSSRSAQASPPRGAHPWCADAQAADGANALVDLITFSLHCRWTGTHATFGESARWDTGQVGTPRCLPSPGRCWSRFSGRD